MQETDKSSFDHVTVALMGSVCEDVWRQVCEGIHFFSQDAEQQARRRMAEAVMISVAAGETDPSSLRAIAVAAVQGN